jgi:hypothetical protein
MTQLKFRLPFFKRVRRMTRRRDDPAAVFKTFVLVLERMQAQSRAAHCARSETLAEKV